MGDWVQVPGSPNGYANGNRFQPSPPTRRMVDCISCGKPTDPISGFSNGIVVTCKPCWRKSESRAKKREAHLARLTPDVVKKASLAMLREIADL